jgi:hypothetical protein
MKLFTKAIDEMLFKQYPLGSDLSSQMVVAKIFNPYGRGTWYLLNSDPQDPDYIWAIVDLFDVEMGSVSRSELEGLKVPPFRLGLERDTFFTPINALTLYQGLMEGKMYKDGGVIKWQDVYEGDSANVKAENKTGVIVKTYGRKFHLKFVDGSEKTYDASELEFFKSEDEFADGGGIGFIPMDLEEKLAITARWGGTNIKGVIGFLNAMIDSDLTDEDLKPNPTKNTRFQIERAEEKKIQEIWKKIKPKYTGGLEGNWYYSTIKRLVQRSRTDDNILKQFKPFRKYQKFADGGEIKFDKEFTNQQLWDFTEKYGNSVYLINGKIVSDKNKGWSDTDYSPRDFFDLLKNSGVLVNFVDKKPIKFYKVDMPSNSNISFTIADFSNFTKSDFLKSIKNAYDKKAIDYSDYISFESLIKNNDFKFLPIADFIDNKMADGGILIPQQGTLYTKDKKSKLEYYKKGNDYAFKVYDVENNPVENYTRNQYKKRSDEEALMTYNQFINYLYSELYIDDKMANGGEIEESPLDDYELWGESPLVAKIKNSKGDKGLFGFYKLIAYSKTAFGKSTYMLVPFGVFRVIDEEKSIATIDFIDKKEDVWRFDTHWIPKNAWIKADEINFDEWNFTKNQLEIYKRKTDAKMEEVINDNILKFQNSFENGGETTFDDKVKAVKSSLLKRKKVAPIVQKDYGKTYSPKEAEESAKRIVGSRVAKWNEKMVKK